MRLWGVFDKGNPVLSFIKKRMPREKRSYMTIRAHSYSMRSNFRNPVDAD
jgi:hypothetical protein